MISTNKAKIDKAYQKIADIDEKIKNLQQEKKDTQKLIKQLQEDDFVAYCKGLDVSATELDSVIELGKYVQSSGLGIDDIKFLVDEFKEKEKDNED